MTSEQDGNQTVKLAQSICQNQARNIREPTQFQSSHTICQNQAGNIREPTQFQSTHTIYQNQTGNIAALTLFQSTRVPQQECIPVGCVPPTAVAIFWGEMSASVHAGIHSPPGMGLDTPGVGLDTAPSQPPMSPWVWA